MERQTSIYRKPEEFIFLSSSRTKGAGLSIGNGHIIRLATSASRDSLHESLMLSLAESNAETLPHPMDWSAYNKTYLKQIGFRSFKELERDAAYCVVTLADGVFTFDVARPNGPGKGYDFTGEEVSVAATETPNSIANTLCGVLDKCDDSSSPNNEIQPTK